MAQLTALETNRNRRARAVTLLTQGTSRPQPVIDAINVLITAGITALDPVSFGFLAAPAGSAECSITAGSNLLNSTDNPWSAADVGKAAYVQGAGAAGGTLATTITSYVSAGQVGLAANAATTVAATAASAGGIAVWGTATPNVIPGVLVDSAGRTLQPGALDLSNLPTSTITPTPGTTPRQITSILGDDLNVRNFGAVGNGIADDRAAFQAAYNAAPANRCSRVIVPYGAYLLSSQITPTAGKFVEWMCAGATDQLGNPLDPGGGYVVTQFQARRLIRKGNSAAADDGSLVNIQRVAAYTGGTNGFVNSALRVESYPGANNSNYEWAIVGVMDSLAGAGTNCENVAVYGQTWKRSTGRHWAATFELRDLDTNPTTASVGVEIDIFGNGDDVSSRRIGIDLVAGKHNVGGAQLKARAGLRVGPVNGDPTSGFWYNCIELTGTNGVGLNVAAATFTGAIIDGSAAVAARGIDLIGAAFSAAQEALRIPSNSWITLDSTASIKMRFNSALNRIEFFNGGTRAGYIDMGGADHAL